MAEENSTIDYKKILKKQRDHEYYLKNKERILQKTAEYEKTHREQRNAAQNRRNANNRELNRKRGLDYFYAHKDEIKQKKQDNKEFYSAQSKKWRTNWKSKLYDILGRKCVRCGYDEDLVCLQFDHIDGDRKNDKKYYGGMHSYCRYYALRPEEARQTLQVLCVSCNWLKRNLEDIPNYFKTRGVKQTKIAAYDRARSIKRRYQTKLKLIGLIGESKCILCGETNLGLLQIDHINGGGKQERKIIKRSFYTYYIKNEEARKNLQVLCVLCNWKKMLGK